MNHSIIESPQSPALGRLVSELRLLAPCLQSGDWPTRQLQLLGTAGVYRWFLPADWGGMSWPEPEIVEGLIALGGACLTTSFILTQRTAACTRLIACPGPQMREEWAEGLSQGSRFATVAISHLTTSRQHLHHNVLRVSENSAGYCLDGYSAWVTGAGHADLIVVGATLPDQRQLLLAVNRKLPGIRVPAPERLVALNASHTGRLEFDRVQVARSALIAGPAAEVMRLVGGGAGGFQTSALAVGLADAAIEWMESEARQRGELKSVAEALRMEWTQIRTELLEIAAGLPSCSRETLRSRANSLVLRATQAALGSAKGAGFVDSHPVGRWCREALFFLVWSCPQSVLAANLCQLALLEPVGPLGISEDRHE